MTVGEQRDDRMDIAVRRLMVEDEGYGAYGAIDERKRSQMIKLAIASAKITSTESAKISRSIKMVGALLASGVAAAAVMFFFWSASERKPDQAAADVETGKTVSRETREALGLFTVSPDGVTADREPIRAGEEILSGQEIEVQKAGAVVEIGRGIQLAPKAGSAFALKRGDAGEMVVSLRKGAIWSAVDPEKKSSNLVVETPRGKVTVKGTVFEVEMKNDETAVKVLRGEVEVTSYGIVRLVSEGQRFVMGASEVEEMDVSEQEDAKEQIERSGLVSADEAASARASGEDAEKKKDRKPARGEKTVSMDELRADIRKLRAARDWRGVESAYSNLIRFHFNTDDARAAMVALGTVRLEKLDDPAGALGAFSSYLESGAKPLAPEALYGKACALGKLGDFRAERDALNAFVEKYPASPQVPSAKKRLAELGQ